MSNFNFVGDWEILVNLPVLSQLNSSKFFPHDSRLEWKSTKSKNLANRLVEVKINDLRNEDPDPTPEQLEAMGFIIDNEKHMYQVVYDAFKNVAIPDFLSYQHFPLEDNTFHKIASIEELPQHLGIDSINITTFATGKYAFSIFNFAFSGDHEHGLCMVFDGDKFLRHDEIGSLTFEGLVPQEELDQRRVEYNRSPVSKFYRPHPKYNKNKPWQEEANTDYIQKILEERSNQEVIDLVNDNLLDLKALMYSACLADNRDIINYLLDRQVPLGQGVLAGMRGLYNKELISFLTAKGAGIDVYNSYNETSLYSEIKQYAHALSHRDFHTSQNDTERLRNDEEEIITRKGNIEFLITMGANPEHCDDKGNDYLTLLKKLYIEDALYSRNIPQYIAHLIDQRKRNNGKT